MNIKRKEEEIAFIKLNTLKTHIRKEIEIFERNKLTECGEYVLRAYKEIETTIK